MSTNEPKLPRRETYQTGTAATWAGGLIAGAQGAALSILLVVVPTISGQVLSSPPGVAGPNWWETTQLALSVWLLGHGGHLSVSSASISLMPLGISLLIVLGSLASNRRSGRATLAGWGTSVVGHLAAVAAVVLMAGPSNLAGGWNYLRLALGAVLLATIGAGTGLGLVKDSQLRATARKLIDTRVPQWLRACIRAGAGATFALLTVSGALTVVWVLAGRAATRDITAALDLDLLAGAFLALGQLGWAPNLVLWASSWLLGSGFAAGAGTHFSPDGSVGGVMPTIPLLGSLPQDGWDNLFVGWNWLLTAGIGALVGLWLLRRLGQMKIVRALGVAATATLVACVIYGTILGGATGGIGPERMAEFGPNWVATVWAFGWQVLVGSAAALVLTNRDLGSSLVELWQRLTGKSPESGQKAAQQSHR